MSFANTSSVMAVNCMHVAQSDASVLAFPNSISRFWQSDIERLSSVIIILLKLVMSCWLCVLAQFISSLKSWPPWALPVSRRLLEGSRHQTADQLFGWKTNGSELSNCQFMPISSCQQFQCGFGSKWPRSLLKLKNTQLPREFLLYCYWFSFSFLSLIQVFEIWKPWKDGSGTEVWRHCREAPYWWWYCLVQPTAVFA